MEALAFIPLLLATLGLFIASVYSKKEKKTWLIIAFIIWLLAFVFTLILNR
ncbi:hypothetical protein J4417_02750 [Candidatus Woesearchaeota archaeon]|nr:hypothetical protein [Candidatus Woesearchaeota archaeon]